MAKKLVKETRADSAIIVICGISYALPPVHWNSPQEKKRASQSPELLSTKLSTIPGLLKAIYNKANQARTCSGFSHKWYDLIRHPIEEDYSQLSKLVVKFLSKIKKPLITPAYKQVSCFLPIPCKTNSIKAIAFLKFI